MKPKKVSCLRALAEAAMGSKALRTEFGNMRGPEFTVAHGPLGDLLAALSPEVVIGILDSWELAESIASQRDAAHERADDAEAEVARLRAVLQRVYDAELDDARERWDAEQLMASVLFPEAT